MWYLFIHYERMFTYIKRIFLFVIVNIAIIAMLSISLSIIQSVFWINISGYWYDYTSVLIFAAIFWFGWAFISLLISRWTAKTLYGVKLVDKNSAVSMWSSMILVYDVIEKLALEHRINVPEVGYYDSADINAFATGYSKNSSLVAVSTGLLQKMSKDEIEWVVAHEMAHILNWDMVTMTLMQWVLNTFVIFIARVLGTIIDNYFKSEDEENTGPWFAYYISSFVLEIIFGIIASLVLMAFSRYREFRADHWSATMVGKSKMIAALKKLQATYETNTHYDDGKMATMKISSSKWWFLDLFSSHPNLSDRIKALEE